MGPMVIKDYGLVLGSFSPMHKGHLDLIMLAKKACRRGVIIAVCGLDGDRGAKIGLPIERRYEIIKNMFANDPLVKVIFMKDNDIGIAGYNDKWKEWLEALSKAMVSAVLGADHVSTRACKKMLGQTALFTGEPTYKKAVEELDLGMNAFVLNRDLNQISATKIRKHPMKHWNDIIGPEYRSAFAKRVLIIGTASEGKSTLTRDLARYFDADYSMEYGHEVIADKTTDNVHPDDTQLVYKDYLDFLNVQYAENSTCTKKIKICDSDAMTTLMYAKYYSTDDRYRITEEDYEKLEKQAKFLKYDAIFVMPPKPDSWVQDGCRDSLTNSFEDRKQQYQVLMKIIGQHYSTEDIVYLNGTYLDNFLIAKAKIKALLSD